MHVVGAQETSLAVKCETQLPVVQPTKATYSASVSQLVKT